MSIIYELLLKEEQVLSKKLKEVREEIEKYKTSSKTAIEYIASEITKPSNNDLIDEDEIKKYSIPQKTLFALKENNRFMKIREIAEFIAGFTDEDVDDLVKQLSRRTKYLREKGKISKIQVGNSKRDTFWGSPNWLDENGEIKSGYEYSKQSINNVQTKLIDL